MSKRHFSLGIRDYDDAYPIRCNCPTEGIPSDAIRCPVHDDCEMANAIAPDAERVIAAPPPLPDDMRARLMRRALILVAAGFALLGALLGMSDPRFTP